MALVRWSPLSTMLSQWPDVWDDEMTPSIAGSNNLDVYETEDEVVVKANVAGIPLEDIDLTYEKGVLWIKADKTQEESDKSKKHYSKSSWSYSYKVAVPGLIDYNQEPKAEVDDGVITVSFKKSEASKPKKLTVSKKQK